VLRSAATRTATVQTFDVVGAGPVPLRMLMKEFTATQIAAALGGHPGSAEQELRLLRLFQSDAGAQGVDTPTLTLPLRGRELTSEPLAKAA
jgi:hypothetical protein